MVAKKKDIKSLRKLPKQVRKRDGTLIDFDIDRITSAVSRAMHATGEGAEGDPRFIAHSVAKEIQQIAVEDRDWIPHVEEIQDIVEGELILMNFAKTAKAYILYRQKRAETRKYRREVPQQVRDLALESKKYFRNQLSEFVYYSTYSKWIPDYGRRETWIETVDRYVDFMRENVGEKLTVGEYAEIREHMLSMSVLGSMRLLWSAGVAARATNVAAYNCSFTAPTKWQHFGEILYILACGSGLGFSVERQFTEQLPIISRQKGKKVFTHVVPDSKEGWADSLVLGMQTWSDGGDIIFDYSQVRPAGSRLVTMGGRSSGPDPLRGLLDFTRRKMFENQGRRLTPIHVHDIICKIGEVIVMGGVRRSALISLSDLEEVEMRDAKSGQFYLTNPERSLSNNSAVYNETPSTKDFLREWLALVESNSGERGIFNRAGLKDQMPERRWAVTEDKYADKMGSNPCGEIVLRPQQFCNLSEVVCRPEDTEKTLMDKVRIATILGTYQSTLTKFPYLSKEWKKNCEEERLLGVSMTGQWDSSAVRNATVLARLRKHAIEVNKKYAKRFGISPSTCITCTKPSGNGSQLFDCASGCHPRYAKYYIRRIRIEKHNPLFAMLKDLNVPHSPEVGQTSDTATTYVLEFPMKAPNGAATRHDISAIDHLEYWKILKENFTEHNPSVTIQVERDEWVKVGNWVFENWRKIGGITFLPKSDHVYRLAPYEEITKEEYERRMAVFPEIDFSKIVLYEYDDQTKGAKELACISGTCEIDILPSQTTIGA
ncbi:MAG: ribonucleoside-triphosphate reductase [Candidatus Vogelbacteria bacterium]|nr:ribonucleoside-triphosphate reductase [Candidatus Vogelbacteria bacterium]